VTFEPPGIPEALLAEGFGTGNLWQLSSGIGSE